MLLEIAVVLVTSVAGLPGTELGAVPPAMRQSISTADAPPAFVHPVGDREARKFGTSDSRAVSSSVQTLSTLARIPVQGISRYLDSHPEFVVQLLAEHPPAHEVALWWGELDADRRAALEIASPQLLGNLEGVPYAIRDTSNRTTLNHTISELTTLINSDAGRAVRQNAYQQLNMLSSISESLQHGSVEPDRTLMTLDVSGQGRAAIVLGSLSDADYVSFLVPGMFFTIENQMPYWVDAANDLYSQQLLWLDRLESPLESGQNHSVATVAWIGYDTPNLTNVGAIDNAYQGRDSLARAIIGLQSQRGAVQPYVSIVAHSYGSTAALMALSEYSFEVDALALVGSPGSPARSVDDLHVRDGNVFVGEAAWDPIPNSSYFGPDPGSASFGAKSLGVSGGFDVILNEQLTGSIGHNEYFQPGSEAMRNFALLCIDRSDLVIPETPAASERAFGVTRRSQS